MHKMTATPFAFYRGTAHIFYRQYFSGFGEKGNGIAV
ncbi:DUF2252 family protein [Nostoc sp.]